ncbi:MAG: hypothetical protein IJI66_02570 [Erysipelotrichaceae bacterium]|nr:hypothetical protein [Erysipelotrichaceae bacterium]
MKKSKRIIISIIIIATLLIIAALIIFKSGSDYTSASNQSNINTDLISESKEDTILTGYTIIDDAEGGSADIEDDHYQDDITNTDYSQSGSEKISGHYEIIPSYDESVLVKEAYDEQILVKKGECTEVKISNAWDEEVWEDGAWYGSDTREAKVCNGCGAVFYGSISEHMSEHPDHGGWHNEQIAQGDPYWHGNRTIIHHDAVYETRCEPDEYTTVHHEAEYKTIHHEEQRIWVDD